MNRTHHITHTIYTTRSFDTNNKFQDCLSIIYHIADLSASVQVKLYLTTARPDWSRCAEYINGGKERWDELSKGLSSEETMEALLAELAGVDLNDITQDVVFQGKVGST